MDLCTAASSDSVWTAPCSLPGTLKLGTISALLLFAGSGSSKPGSVRGLSSPGAEAERLASTAGVAWLGGCCCSSSAKALCPE